MSWLVERFAEKPDATAFVHGDRAVDYASVVTQIDTFALLLRARGVKHSQLVCLVGDYSPEWFCMMLALAVNHNVIVPLTRTSVVEKDSALAICGCDWLIELPESEAKPSFEKLSIAVDNALVAQLQKQGTPGLILFSSGSTGQPKAILHDFDKVAAKFIARRPPVVAIPFLMVDHFGGINTILGIVANLGTVVTVADRSIDAICEAIERHRVELLPTTPSFLTMMMVSGVTRDHDLSSLKRITYGTEVMHQSTLDRLRSAFPGVALQQTYGLSEVGVMRSKSRDDGSLWLKLGGEGFQTKVVDDVLWIKSDFAMLGYLNAPSKFDADGWFNTQDRVEVEDGHFRILGRTTDLINVGGQKVYPSEIEEVILQMENISDVAVFGEPHPLLGSIVVAKVLTIASETVPDLKRRIRTQCATVLSNYKVPTKVVLADGPLYNSRQKKVRR